MSRKLRLRLVPLVAATARLAAAAPANASGVVDPAPIEPNQAFVGEVNDQATSAVIRTSCFGPVQPGQLGHPMDGQTVKALPVTYPTPQLVGFTGSAAHQLNASFGVSSSAPSPVVLSFWAVPGRSPTTLLLPATAPVPSPSSRTRPAPPPGRQPCRSPSSASPDASRKTGSPS